MKKTVLLVALMLPLAYSAIAGPGSGPLTCFTDETIALDVDRIDGKAEATLSVITRDGIRAPKQIKVTAQDGKVSVPPITEGIHILRIADGEEIRFLAMSPPPNFDRNRALKALPRNGKDLLDGRAFVIIAMGDSVTFSGDYEGILQKMLARATGNKQITILDKSYPGRSVDAAVRFFHNDVLPNKPHLGLLMYGLNDQSGSCSPTGFTEQYRYVARRLGADCNADCVFLQPTPHIDIPVGPRKPNPDHKPNRPEFAFRTIGFAHLLKSLGKELNVPVAETFQAIWGSGRKTIPESAQAMWPLFPPHHSKQMHSMAETKGNGDTIHPNALGHLMIAKATLNAMLGIYPPKPPLLVTATSEWRETGVVSVVTVTNQSETRRNGRMVIYGRTECPNPGITTDTGYDLAPGSKKTFTVSWPTMKTPRDLLQYPANASFAPGKPILGLIDFAHEQTRVYGVPSPFSTVQYKRGRQVVSNGNAVVEMTDGSRETLALPKEQVGRIPLIKKVNGGWAVAELAFVQFAQALSGNAMVDGRLEEWRSHNHWAAVGEPCQARWTKGPSDNRADKNECYLSWSMKAGDRGIFIGIRALGEISTDGFTIFFDTRKPELLGTAGRYYWISGSMQPDGKIKNDKGETSKTAPGMTGRWTQEKARRNFEIFIPYEALELKAWPGHRDLGVSLCWTHNGPEGVTHLQWSEDGHPWNSRWYGVARLQDKRGPLPRMVRVK